MTLRPTALIFAPGCALAGALFAGWSGAATACAALGVFTLGATAVHAWMTLRLRGQDRAERAHPPEQPANGGAGLTPAPRLDRPAH